MSLEKVQDFFSKVEDFVGEGKNKDEYLEICREVHDKLREDEKLLKLPKPKSALLHLYIEGMDHDQIAHQFAANDKDLLAIEEDSGCGLMHQITQLRGQMETSPTELQILYDISLKIPKKCGRQAEDKNSHSDEQDDESEGSELEEDSEDETMNEETNDKESDNGNTSSTDEGLFVSDEEGSDEADDENDSDEENISDAEEKDDEGKSTDSDDDSEGGEHEPKIDSAEASDADSDDSAYDELDKQLFKRYINDGDNDKESSEDEDCVEDLAGASESETDEESQGKLMDEEEEREEEEEENVDLKGESDNNEYNDSDNKPVEKRKKTVHFDTSTTTKINRKNPLQKVLLPNFSSSSVDSQFFNVRESEYVADEDIIGADNFKDIDFMEDITDNEDDNLCGDNATYKDFFDAPPSEAVSKGPSQNVNEDNWGLQEDSDVDDVAAPAPPEAKDEPMDTSTADQVKSRYELDLEVENKLRKEMEESNISEKPWAMKGEALAESRPTNSALTEYLDFRSGAKLRPTINEELCSKVERIVLDRFRAKAFDDVERKAKLVDDPFEFKKKIVLDEEKSSKSLSKIYEEEYLKKQRQDSAQKAEEELPEHKKIRLAYEELEDYLDALSNAHYTPKLKQPELKIMSNLRAMQLEENTPVVANDGDVLAPQEIAAPMRGLLKGDSEKTTTDKKRERRQKKHTQHLKFVRDEKNINDKIKKAAKEGKKLDVDTSAKVVKTALKSGKVKRMDSNGPNIKSSTSFFKHLSEQHDAATKKASLKRKRDDAR